MNGSSTKAPFLIASFLAAIAFNVTAETTQDGVRNLVMQAANASENGVIMAVSERGNKASEASYLLYHQLDHNPGFKPLLMVPVASELNASLQALALSKETLPALIFYDKAGKEMGRVVNTTKTAGKLL